MRSRRILTHALPILTAGVLAFSCGGGGGDGGDDGGGAQRVAITTNNAPEVAEAAFSSMSFVFWQAEFNEILLEGFADLPAPRRLNRTTGEATALRKLGRTTLALFIQDTEDCDLSGTFDVILDVETEEMLAEGDMLSVEFNSCQNLNYGMATVDGTVTSEVTDVSGAFPIAPYDLSFTLGFDNVLFAYDEGPVTIDGDLDHSLETPDDIAFNTTLSIHSLKTTWPGGSGTIDYTARSTFNEITGAYTIEVEGTLEDSDIGGSVTLETTTPFAGVEPDDPDSGVLVVTGADNSSLTVVALDSVNVELRVDENGDGTPEEIIPTTWADLEFEF